MALKNCQLTLLFLSFVFVLNIHSIALAQDVKAAYWFPASEFAVSDIDATLFTHLFCAFADINQQTNQLFIYSSDANAFASFTPTLQAKNPSIKTLLSIGGGSACVKIYANMAKQSASRKAFIDSSIKLARQNKFDGLDLDYEYPITQTDMTNLGTLLNEWRAAIVAESQSSGQAQLLLSAAVSFSPSVNSLTYPTDSINRNLDFINVMAYDFYAPSRTPVTSGHAVLNDPASSVSGSAGIRAWIQAGMSVEKLVLGLPYYGYAWKLVNPQNHGVGAAASGPALPGDGSITYKGIKNFTATNNAPVVHNATLVFDYTYSGTTWIGYDDVQTISDKVSFAKRSGLRGYFAWHVANDDNWVLSKAAVSAWEAQVSQLIERV